MTQHACMGSQCQLVLIVHLWLYGSAGALKQCSFINFERGEGGAVTSLSDLRVISTMKRFLTWCGKSILGALLHRLPGPPPKKNNILELVGDSLILTQKEGHDYFPAETSWYCNAATPAPPPFGTLTKDYDTTSFKKTN